MLECHLLLLLFLKHRLVHQSDIKNYNYDDDGGDGGGGEDDDDDDDDYCYFSFVCPPFHSVWLL